MARWIADDIDIVILKDATDDPIVGADIITPAGVLSVMAEVSLSGRALSLSAFHMHAESGGPHLLGVDRLRQLASCVMEKLDVDGLRIEGAVRTTGANPRRRPRPIRFSRKGEPAGGA